MTGLKMFETRIPRRTDDRLASLFFLVAQGALFGIMLPNDLELGPAFVILLLNTVLVVGYGFAKYREGERLTSPNQ